MAVEKPHDFVRVLVSLGIGFDDSVDPMGVKVIISGVPRKGDVVDVEAEEISPPLAIQ
jgi:hypothetical protein